MGPCLIFRKIYEKHKAEEALSQEGAIKINNFSFAKHDDRAKVHVIMVFTVRWRL